MMVGTPPVNGSMDRLFRGLQPECTRIVIVAAHELAKQTFSSFWMYRTNRRSFIEAITAIKGDAAWFGGSVRAWALICPAATN